MIQLADAPNLVIQAEADLPTRRGVFRLSVVRWSAEPDKEHVVLRMGDVRGADVLLRVHSECLTSEVLGSLKCDCAEQLDAALERVARAKRGLVIYLRQEGRGIGLSNKIRAYALQARGLDTLDANRALGLPDDARRYDATAAVLSHYGVSSVRLMTNNPEKVTALRELGVRVRRIEPIVVAPNPHSAPYLVSKRERMGHALPY